jgi:uncharacterized coiled-coil protein SlyX
MKTPTLPAETPSDRIVLIPDAAGSRSRLLIALIALALVAAMLLGGGIVYAWQQGQIRDRDQLVHTARVDTATAQNQTGATLAEVTALRAHVAELESRLAAQQESLNILHGEKTEAQGRVERTQADLAAMRARLAAVTGPPVANGRHIAYIRAAATEQSPPMIVIDVGRWFAGNPAHQAAIDDGALTTGEHLFQGHYLRNTDHVWRILTVRPGALFTIHTYTGTPSATNVTLTTLASILASPSFADGRIAHDPFWIDVEGHRVASGHQQIYRAP